MKNKMIATLLALFPIFVSALPSNHGWVIDRGMGFHLAYYDDGTRPGDWWRRRENRSDCLKKQKPKEPFMERS